MTRPPGTFIVGTVHPARLFRDQTLQFACFADWQKAARVQREGPSVVPPPVEEWQWMPSVGDVCGYMAATCGTAQGVEDRGPWAIDFENTIDGRPVCMSLWSCQAPTRHRGLCIPFLAQGGGPYWSREDEPRVLDLVFDFLRDPQRGKVAHNGVGHDYGYPPWNSRALVKRAWDIDVQGIVGDSMALHHVCFAELRHSLAFCASIATDLGPFKITVHETDETSTEKAASEWLGILDRPDKVLRTYNLYDSFAGAMVWNQLAEEAAA